MIDYQRILVRFLFTHLQHDMQSHLVCLLDLYTHFQTFTQLMFLQLQILTLLLLIYFQYPVQHSAVWECSRKSYKQMCFPVLEMFQKKASKQMCFQFQEWVRTRMANYRCHLCKVPINKRKPLQGALFVLILVHFDKSDEQACNLYSYRLDYFEILQAFQIFQIILKFAEFSYPKFFRFSDF